MNEPAKLDNRTPLERILDDHLNIQLLCQCADRQIFFSGPIGENARRRLFADLLERTGELLTSQLCRQLSPEEVMQTFERVKKLLVLWGLY